MRKNIKSIIKKGSGKLFLYVLRLSETKGMDIIMRIDIGQTTNLFHVDALNKNMIGNAQGKQETKRINILPRKDVATISPMGKASSALQNLVNQIEVNQEGIKDQNPQKDSGHVNDEDSPETVEYKISKEGQEHFQNQVENGTRGTFSDQNLDWTKVQQDSVYYEIIEKSDNGFNNPTIEMQLFGTYSVYLNEVYEQGIDPGVNIYDHIVNMHKDSLVKAYQDIYNDIVTGYENGTREVWTQDFEEGADYIEFELEGRNYRFHKLTMEEELGRLDKAYEKVARVAADGANIMINTEKMIEKVMPEYREKMREIGVQRAREISGIGESPETIAERIKNKISMTDQNTERINLFEIFMEAKNNWLMQKRYETGSHSK